MLTHDALRQLSDAQFHALGDDVLRRMDPRYYRLRTHGLNAAGKSIKGQPDSYVGNTAASCSIAVCYTTQERRWWEKVIEDIVEARSVSPAVSEIVAVVPHNVDRDGPTRAEKNEWQTRAVAAAGSASLRIVDGREIAQRLDDDFQDIRYEHLGIPYSRISASSILQSARLGTSSAVEAIQSSGRYDPNRYAQRAADHELYALWQRCLKKESEEEEGRRVSRVRLLALVNDAGIGKTSLVCSFAESLASVHPVVLVQARDLAFGAEDVLVSHVIQGLEGNLHPDARAGEEIAIVRNIAGMTPLTLIVDGLDEAHDPNAVRRSITYWLQSRLGQCSVLIVTSRPEFWRSCSDPYWLRWMPEKPGNDRSPIRVAHHPILGLLEEGARIPDLFSDLELEAAWKRGGRELLELHALSELVRAELRHPFTLRTYLDLWLESGAPPPFTDRAELMEQWLSRRLEMEATKGARISPTQLHEALKEVARSIAQTNGGSIGVDELRGVPRFDPANPPGPIVERLIDVNILQTVATHADRIRFANEAVQDFYRAETDVDAVKADPDVAAKLFAGLPFTAMAPRLLRVGRLLMHDEGRHRFVDELGQQDSGMASLVVRTASQQYSGDTRAKIAESLGRDIASRHRVRAALAITLLGEMQCSEAIDVLANALMPPADPHQYLKSLGAYALVKVGYPEAAEFVYKWHWFSVGSGNETYYFRDQLSTLRNARPGFRDALANVALARLVAPSGTREHAKAVCVLAYLGDNRLIEHVESRLSANGLLTNYENHALLALGTDAAGRLFVRSLQAVGLRLAVIPDDHEHNDERNDLIWPIHHITGDIRYLITPAFGPHLQTLVEDANPTISWLTSDLARRARVASLYFRIAEVFSKRTRSIDLDRDRGRNAVTPSAWLEWWGRTLDVDVHRELLARAPFCPTPDVENVLITCLDSPLKDLAVRRLGEYGSVRSAPWLRAILAEPLPEGEPWDQGAAAEALGKLRDAPSVPLLVELIKSRPNTWAALQAIVSLGQIGTIEAEQALCALIEQLDESDEIYRSLLVCGTSTAVAIVLAKAKQMADGMPWLLEQLHRLRWAQGWSRGEYYTHIETTAIVDYVSAHSTIGSPGDNWNLVDAFSQIDSPDARRLLQDWGRRRGTAMDPIVRESDQRRMSDMCYWELADRGDPSAVAYILDQRTDEKDDIYVAIASDHLSYIRSSLVAPELRKRLAATADDSQTVRMLALLGRFGDACDSDMIAAFVGHPNDLVANIAYESRLRLTDPLRVPDRWREL